MSLEGDITISTKLLNQLLWELQSILFGRHLERVCNWEAEKLPRKVVGGQITDRPHQKPHPTQATQKHIPPQVTTVTFPADMSTGHLSNDDVFIC
jgi:hypothetical protein